MEMIFAVVIIGVLASLAIPRYTFSLEKMRLAEGLQILETLRSAQYTYRTENGSYANALALLDVEINAPANFAVPSVAAANPIATIVRSAPASYILTINADGTISCAGGSPADICAKIGCDGGTCN
jgi:type II secretory pathway pseudopilin PulG